MVDSDCHSCIDDVKSASFYVALENGYSFHVVDSYKEKFDHFSMIPHAHKSIELIYVVDGECILNLDNPADSRGERIEGKNYISLHSKDFVFLDAYQWHQITFDINSENPSVRLMCLRFESCPDGQSGDFSLLTLMPQSSSFVSFLMNATPYVYIPHAKSLEPLFSHLMIKLDQDGMYDKLHKSFLEQQLQHFFIEIADLSNQSRSNNIHPYISKMLDYIEENFEHDLSIEKISEFVSLHPAYIQRLFKKYKGYSIMQYVMQLRMKKAGLLLRNTDLSMSEVASDVGFKNRQTFNAAFMKYYNITPLNYRRKTRKNMLN